MPAATKVDLIMFTKANAKLFENASASGSNALSYTTTAFEN